MEKQVADKATECEKVKAELDDFRNEHQPLDINPFIDTGPTSRLLLRIYNPSTYTAATNVKVELSAIDPSLKWGHRVALAGHEVVSEQDKITQSESINPRDTLYERILSFEHQPGGHLLRMSVLLKGKLFGETLVVEPLDKSAPTYRPFDIILSVGAAERPTVPEKFRITATLIDGGKLVFGVAKVPER